MHLKVRFAAGAANEVGIRETFIETSSDPTDFLKCLEEQTGFPVWNKYGVSYMVLVNGRVIKRLIQEGSTIEEGDSIMVVPYLGGG